MQKVSILAICIAIIAVMLSKPGLGQQSYGVTSTAHGGGGGGGDGKPPGVVTEDGRVPTPPADEPGAPTAPSIEEDEAITEFTVPGEQLAAAPLSLEPGMIGDLVNSSSSFGTGSAPLPIAGGDRRFKVSDNTSPFPKDRLFFNFNHFENGLRGSPQFNLQRYTFGFEKTLNEGLWSVELRIPFADGLSARQLTSGAQRGTEFGNVTLSSKTILWDTGTTAFSAGLATTLPTADDAVLDRPDSTRVLNIENEATFLQPYVGMYTQPSDRLFVQGFMAWDFDLNGNEVRGGGERAVLQEQHLMYVDVSAGYWLRRDCCRYLRGIAPMVELHYTTTLNDADFVTVNNETIGNFANRFDLLNLTAGLMFQLTEYSNLRVAGAAPLRDDPDRAFDSEVLVQFNRRY